MKTLLHIETYGIVLNYDGKEYIFEYADTYAPAWHEVRYETLEEALGDIVNYILDPDNVYAMEDQPEDLREAYEELGVPSEVNPGKKEIAAGTFLYYVLDGIVRGNE